MNQVFAPFLQKFVIVFFNDILIYNSNMDDHQNHLKIVFQTLVNILFAKSTIQYLGRLVSA